MASQATLTIRVQSSRSASRIQYSTNGRYINLATNGLSEVLAQQPVLTTASAQAFWAAVLAIVTPAISA